MHDFRLSVREQIRARHGCQTRSLRYPWRTLLGQFFLRIRHHSTNGNGSNFELLKPVARTCPNGGKEKSERALSEMLVISHRLALVGPSVRTDQHGIHADLYSVHRRRRESRRSTNRQRTPHARTIPGKFSLERESMLQQAMSAALPRGIRCNSGSV